MNDDSELMTAVRESFAGVRLDIPLEVTVRRARARRARRRLVALAGTAAIASGTALAVLGLVPGGAATSPPARLAAWTVTRQPDGTVAVTIRDVRDAAALQRKLNEDGVRAQVLAADDMPPGCENVPGTNKDINAIVTDLMAPGTTRYFVIHPDAIPADSTLQLDIFPPITPAHHATGRRISNRQSASGFGEQNVPSVAMFLIYTGSHC